MASEVGGVDALSVLDQAGSQDHLSVLKVVV